MIIASLVLVVVAIGLLVAGILLPQMLFIYVSIGLSALAALLLGAGAFRRRDELVRAEKEREPAAPVPEGASTSGGWQARTPPRPVSAGSSSAGVAGAATATKPAEAATDVPDDAQVWVVSGWRKYHLPGCRQLRRQQAQEMSYAEATEQGYTMCASCMPDTALAARERSGDDSGPRVGSESVTSSSGTDRELSSPDEADSSEAAGAAAAAGAAGQTSADAETSVDTETSADTETSVGTKERSDTEEGEERDLVGMVSGGRRFHRLTCAVVEDATQDGVELTTMSRNEAEATDAIPCTVCQP